ncbi:SPOR domain-containing protein [Mesorhizobium sp. CAU 1741]|uniref:SPOR domain-containing protein n=1 Tax=Mesorhizobium sp. CAU 1741 TaxID=3140366 RepID=UPI00325AD4A6
MADSNHTTRDDFAGFSDDDPFAELTRIMGHDPRGAQNPPAPVDPEPASHAAAAGQGAFEDDFDIDLEQELMGELDFYEFEEQPEVATEQADAMSSSESYHHADHASAPVEHDQRTQYADSRDSAFADRSNEGASADAIEPDVSYHGAEQDIAYGDDFGDALERELMGDAYVADYRDQQEIETAPLADEEPTAAIDPQPIHDELSAEWDNRPVQQASDPWEAEASASSGVEASSQSFEPAIIEEPAAELTLEDELHALLSDDAPTTVSPQPMESWAPVASALGRANFAAARPSQPIASAPFAGYDGEPAASSHVNDRVDDLRRHEDELSAQGEVEEFTPAEDEFDDIFGGELDFDVEASDMQPSNPEPAPIPDVSGLDVLAAWTPERERIAQPVFQGGGYNAPSAPSAPAADDAPEIETIDLQEAPIAMADDLEIPDVAYDTPAAASGPYDDLEGEIAEAFGDLSLEDPDAATSAAQLEPSMEWSGTAAATGGVAAGAAYSMASGGESTHREAESNYGFGQAAWEASPAPKTQDDFDYEADLDEAIAMAAYEEDEPVASNRRRRGPMIAAIVAGVAVFGGAGVLAMSLFGGGSDAPAVVLADTEPMKVKPENPGGVTVPNQDSQVYQRVATGEPEPAPEQAQLISTAEEPVDVTAQGNNATALPPGITDEIAEAAGPGAGDGIEKSEERLQPTDEAETSGLSQDVAVVAPRRVRTMIVRPDGTMVPREETTPASAAPQTGETVIAAAPLAGATTLQAPGAPAAATLPGIEAAGEDDAGPQVDTPDTVGVVPSQRTEPTTAVAAAPRVVQQPEVAQRPAATPVSAPATPAPTAAASSEWSMQIASQPTADGAQSTYQDLARRYGDVLAGRGVNIVRADIQGKGTYYRVRIPATNRDEAIQLCTRYKSAGGSCFVSR